jgi:uncharacterized protein (DUF697 family)/tellurite resistance protein
MNEQEQAAVLTVCLMAAFADGAKDEREREAVRRIAESIAEGTSINLAGLYQDVLLKRRSLDQVAAALQSAEAKQLAYEMAVCVCDADGARNAAERDFLDRLSGKLGLDAGAARSYAEQADEIAAAPIGAAAAGAASAAAGPVVAAQAPNEAELDKMILNYSILNGALELLPQSMASMAIIPLQMKMVYRVGKAYGFELDRGHIKDLLATLGVGLTSQYVEEIGRKFIGGLLRKVGGGLAGAIGRQATGSAFSFGSTWALGHVAKLYYGGGRRLDMTQLKERFQALVGEAQGLRTKYAGEIEQKARTIDVNQLVGMIRQN